MLWVMRASLALIVIFLSAGCGLLLDPDPPATPVGDAAVSDSAGRSCRADRDCGPCGDCRDGVCFSLVGDRCQLNSPCIVRVYTCEEGVRACEETGIAPAGDVCRPAENACDAVEVCDGVGRFCPEDQAIVEGEPCPGGVCDAEGTCASDCVDGDPCETGNGCEIGKWSCDPTLGRRCEADGVHGADYVCRETEGLCDVPETCDGSSGVCPPDQFEASGFECGMATSECDLPEVCDGASEECPEDGPRRDAGHACGAGGYCDGDGACDAMCPVGAPCRVPGSPCGQAEITSCSVGIAMCTVTGAPRPMGEVCRPGLGECGVPEVCDGVSYECPPDLHAPMSQECRSAVDVCDVAEFCTGALAGCPMDEYAATTEVCRSAPTGSCDVAESCTGSSPDCPADGVVPMGTDCGGLPTGGACDAPDSCDGTSAVCDDSVAPTGTVCRPKFSACEADAVCDGSTLACPANMLAGTGTPCGCGMCVAGSCTNTAMSDLSCAGGTADICCVPSASAIGMCSPVTACPTYTTP